MKIQVFDPPMCCSTGVCGPAVDPELVRFAADLDRLKRQGVDIERYNLSQQPAAFASTTVVWEALAREGNDCLPMTLVDGKVVCKGRYPTREDVAGLVSLGARTGSFTNPVRRLPVIQPQPDGPRSCCGPSLDDSAAAGGKRGKGGCC